MQLKEGIRNHGWNVELDRVPVIV